MYKDRGIMKWAPFDALVGFHGLINDLKYNRNKIEKPILTQDILDEFTITINKAIEKDLEVEVQYFNNGYYKSNVDKIKEVNMINKTIVFKSLFIINMSDVTNINI